MRGILATCAWVALGGCGVRARGGSADPADSGPAPGDASSTADGGASDDPIEPADAGEPPAVDCEYDHGILSGADCLPRCQAATRDRVEGCGGLHDPNSDGCTGFQIDSDATPPLEIDGSSVDCATCIQAQANKCTDLACHEPYFAYYDCLYGDSIDCEWERNDLEDCEAENVTSWECFDRETDLCYASADVATVDGGACDAVDAGFHVCRVYPEYDAYSEEEQTMLAENCTTEVLGAWVDDCATQDILGVCSFSSEGSYPMELYFYPPTPLEDARAVCADGGGTWSGA